MKPSIGVLIPTFQAANHLPQCLPPLLQSSLKPQILVIDSSSTDDTVNIASSMGAQTLVIPQSEFNHGLTRERGRLILNTDIIVMMTQDAYASSPDMLEHLVRPILEKKASISYARQLPHKEAGFFGKFARQFNYPSVSHIRSLTDISQYGVYTFFCSNSCAAYLNTSLDEMGGFPSTLFGEDSIVVAQLLKRGHKIAYVSEAQVHHSHDYTLKQEFSRHFDMGLSRREYRDLLSSGGSENQRGKEYLKCLLNELWNVFPHLIPYGLLQTLAKWSGYKLGQASLNAPVKWKEFFSGQKSYWKLKK